MAINDVPFYTVFAIPLSTAETNGKTYQDVGYFHVIRFQTSADLNDISAVTLEGQINLSLGRSIQPNPIPLLYNAEAKFPEGAQSFTLSWPAQSGKWAIVAMASSPNTLDLDTPNPKQLVTTSFGGSIDNRAVTVTDVATLIDTSNSGRFSAMIQNNGSNIAYIGNVGVTTANGMPLAPGATIILDKQTAAIYGICAAGLTSDIRVLTEDT